MIPAYITCELWNKIPCRQCRHLVQFWYFLSPSVQHFFFPWKWHKCLHCLHSVFYILLNFITFYRLEKKVTFMLFCTELTLLTWKRRKVPEEPQRRPSAHWKANGLKNKVRWPDFSFSFFFKASAPVWRRVSARFRTEKYQKISIFRIFDHFSSDFFDIKEKIVNKIFCRDRRSISWKSEKTKKFKNIWPTMGVKKKEVQHCYCYVGGWRLEAHLASHVTPRFTPRFTPHLTYTLNLTSHPILSTNSSLVSEYIEEKEICGWVSPI